MPQNVKKSYFAMHHTIRVKGITIRVKGIVLQFVIRVVTA